LLWCDRDGHHENRLLRVLHDVVGDAIQLPRVNAVAAQLLDRLGERVHAGDSASLGAAAAMSVCDAHRN
jgi:hypothetical protein